MKLSEDSLILFLEPAVKAKMLKSLVVSFWTFFKFLGNQSELERTETIENFC